MQTAIKRRTAILKIFAATLLITSILSSCADSAPATIEVKLERKQDFITLKSSPLPKSGSDQWYAYSYADSYYPRVTDNKLYLDSTGAAIPTRLEVEGGYIEGVDTGEFGGEVTFHSDAESYVLVDDNFRGFVKIGDSLYLLTGLSHMGLDSGYMYKLDFKASRWTAQKVLNLDACPQSFLVVGDTLYVTTSKKLLKIKSEHSRTLVRCGFWDGLYPTTMEYYNNSLIIGMRGGIYTYHLSKRTEHWYDPEI